MEECAQIISVVAEAMPVRPNDIQGDRREQGAQVAMYLTHKTTGLSYPAIGKRFGGKDHSTVMNAERRIPHLMDEDNEIDEVESLMRGAQRVSAARAHKATEDRAPSALTTQGPIATRDPTVDRVTRCRRNVSCAGSRRDPGPNPGGSVDIESGTKVIVVVGTGILTLGTAGVVFAERLVNLCQRLGWLRGMPPMPGPQEPGGRPQEAPGGGAARRG